MVSNIVLSVILIILSLVWGYIGIFKLGLWIPGISANSGFIPTVFSAVLLVCSIIMLKQAINKRRNDEAIGKTADNSELNSTGIQPLEIIKKYSVIFFGIFGIFCLQYLGLIPMSFLIIFGWMKLLNKMSWAKSFVIAAIVTLCIYLIFDFWLKIPFPGLI